jgi:chemotaxis response regulator CheB
VSLALQSLGYTIVGTASDRCETLRLLKALTPDLVVISPRVLEKTGMGLVRELLAKKPTSVFVVPGHPLDPSARSTSLLRPTDLGSLLALSRVIQVLFGRLPDRNGMELIAELRWHGSDRDRAEKVPIRE